MRSVLEPQNPQNHGVVNDWLLHIVNHFFLFPVAVPHSYHGTWMVQMMVTCFHSLRENPRSAFGTALKEKMKDLCRKGDIQWVKSFRNSKDLKATSGLLKKEVNHVERSQVWF